MKGDSTSRNVVWKWIALLVLMAGPALANGGAVPGAPSLQDTALLEFRLTHPRNDELVSTLMSGEACPEGYERGGGGFVRAANYDEVAARPGYAARLAAFHTPDPRYQFMLEKGGDGSYRAAFVSRSAPARDAKGDPQPITGEYLTAVDVVRDVVGSVAIGLSFNEKGARLLSDVTRNYMAHGPKNPGDRGRQLAIILDGNLLSAPVIQSEIGAHCQITGHFSDAEARGIGSRLDVLAARNEGVGRKLLRRLPTALLRKCNLFAR